MLVILLLCGAKTFAADSLRLMATRNISARKIATDNIGNVYAILSNNTVARYNEHGDSTGFYRSALNGAISFIDATNPQKLLLYFSSFNKIAILDWQLALKAEIDLRKQGIFTPTAVATASDGNLWVYDPVNAKLLKLDESGAPISEGIDLRQQLSFVPKATFLTERDRRIYMCDTAHGILIFDQFATYITTIPFLGIPSIQAFDQQIVFIKNDTLHNYNMQTAFEKTLPLPINGEQILDARLTRQNLFVLYKQHLIYWVMGLK